MQLTKSFTALELTFYLLCERSPAPKKLQSAFLSLLGCPGQTSYTASCNVLFLESVSCAAFTIISQCLAQSRVLMLVEWMDATCSRSHNYSLAGKNENPDLCSPRLVAFGKKKLYLKKLLCPMKTVAAWIKAIRNPSEIKKANENRKIHISNYYQSSV